MNTALAAGVIYLRPSRGKGISLRRLTQTRSNGVPVDIRTTNFEVFSIADAVVREPSLPHGNLGAQPVREAPLDKPNGAFEGDGLRSKQQMNVIGHDDKGVEFVVTFGPVVLEGFDKEFSVGWNLEETASVVGSAGNEKCSRA